MSETHTEQGQTDAVDTEATLQQDRPQTPEGFIALDKHQKDVNVQHKKYRDEERAKIKQQQRADKAEAALQELQTEQVTAQIPSVPDPYSTTYAEDVVKRDEAIRLDAEHSAQIKKAEEDRQVEKDARASQASERAQERVKGFDANMLSLGLDPAITKQAADTLIGYGITSALEDFVLEDPQGPLFVAYLAQNPVEIEALNGLSSYELGRRLDGDIRTKAALLKPQTSNAPPPPITISGSGVPEQKESWEQGAKYE